MTLRTAIRRIAFAGCLCLSWPGLTPVATAEEKVPASPDDRAADRSDGQNPGKKTLGGRQFWGDVRFFHGWRIQENIVTGHFRLLDPDDYRHASGSRAECDAALKQIAAEKNLGPMTGKAVILVHGIVRSSKSFKEMAERLEKQGYTAVGFDYPSTRTDLRDSAEYLHSVIESLEGIEEINFVVHSMGGIVVRTYLDKHEDKRIKRMVMMGVPNRGANLADRLEKNALYRAIYGPAGQQLVSDPEGLIAKLPIPRFEFAIIAGGRENDLGYNPLIPGDDDGTVSVTSARLPGATDYMLVRRIHSFLMKDADVIAASLRFLESGKLREAGEPHPIPAEVAEME